MTPRLKNKRPLVVGVTGGMASGKSSIARMICGRGIIHVDADKLVHELLQHDRSMIADIAAAFPKVVVATNHGAHSGCNPGEGRDPRADTINRELFHMDPGLRRDDARWRIDRAALAAHITKNPNTLGVLESLIHPRVRAQEEAIIAAARRNRVRAVVLDVPLLFETDADVLCDVVIVAHAPLAHRRARALTRPGMSEQKWQRLLDRQLPDHVRNRAADVVISTAIGKAATRKEIAKLMHAWGLR